MLRIDVDHTLLTPGNLSNLRTIPQGILVPLRGWPPLLAITCIMAVIAIPPLSVALPEMRDGLALLVVGTIFASFLIPAGILLFFFTRPSIWRSPLFIFNVCAIILGLVQQGLFIYVIVSSPSTLSSSI